MCTEQQTYQRSLRRVKSQLHKLEEENDVLQNDIPAEPMGERMQPELKCRDHNRFNDNLRKTVMQLQSECNVPASKCASVIKVVANSLFGVLYV